jgi:hypothetical protein
MRKILLAAAVVLGFALAPLAAQAQAPAAKPGDVFGLNSSQVVAIGLGVVGGAIVAESIVGMPVWAGAAAGAIVGNWYYSQEGGAPVIRRANAMADEARVYLINATENAAGWLRQ